MTLATVKEKEWSHGDWGRQPVVAHLIGLWTPASSWDVKGRNPSWVPYSKFMSNLTDLVSLLSWS